MLLEDMSWRMVEKYLNKSHKIVLVLGATEEHADLSLCTDALIPYKIAEEACARENIILAPPLYYGISTWSLGYPGTISLKTETYLLFIKDIIESLLRHGFRQFFILNGHGFNRSAAPAFGEKIADIEGANALFIQWYELPSAKSMTKTSPGGHASYMEAFPFTKTSRNKRTGSLKNFMPNLLQPCNEIRRELQEGYGVGELDKGNDVMMDLLEQLIGDFQEIIRNG